MKKGEAATMNERDTIRVEGQDGRERDLAVEALFDMNEDSYALLKDEEDLILMKIENEGGEQYLSGITDPNETDLILTAYQIAVHGGPINCEEGFTKQSWIIR